MKRIAGSIAVLCGCSLLAAVSVAQYPGGYGGAPGNQGGLQYTRPPVLSPFLNLNLPGDPAINYYGLVRQQVAVNRAIQKFGTDVNYLEGSALANQDALQTGHLSFFSNQYPYFANQGVYFNNTATGGRGAINRQGASSATAPQSAGPPRP